MPSHFGLSQYPHKLLWKEIEKKQFLRFLVHVQNSNLWYAHALRLTMYTRIFSTNCWRYKWTRTLNNKLCVVYKKKRALKNNTYSCDSKRIRATIRIISGCWSSCGKAVKVESQRTNVVLGFRNSPWYGTCWAIRRRIIRILNVRAIFFHVGTCRIVNKNAADSKSTKLHYILQLGQKL